MGGGFHGSVDIHILSHLQDHGCPDHNYGACSIGFRLCLGILDEGGHVFIYDRVFLEIIWGIFIHLSPLLFLF